jgi:hypothetical protein
MLSSITPLGQRGRGGSWTRTVIGFWIGAVLAGAALFTVAGFLGSLLGLDRFNPWISLIAIAAAAVLDLTGVRPLGPHRQVDEDWLGRYRDWVIGFGFGAQLGLGFVTIVPSFGYWALLIVAASVGLPGATLIGVGFGVGRSLLLLTARRVGSPSALAEMMRRFTGAEPLAKKAALAAYGMVILTVVLYVN